MSRHSIRHAGLRWSGSRPDQTATRGIGDAQAHSRPCPAADGWARNVGLDIGGGTIAAVAAGVPPPKAASASPASRCPACRTCTAIPSSAAWRGLPRRAGRQADSFWTWRQVMYRFLGARRPDDVEAIAAFAMMEMLEGGLHRARPSSTTCTTIRDGRPYADLAELARRIAAAAQETGIGPDAAAGLLCAGRLRRRAARARGSGASSTMSRAMRACSKAPRKAVAGLDDAVVGIAPHSLRAVTPESSARCRRVRRRRADPYPRRRAGEGGRGLPRLVGPAPGRVAARSCAGRPPLVPDPRHPSRRAARSRGIAARGRGGGPVPDHRGQSRRRHLRGRRLSRGRRPLRRRVRFQHRDLGAGRAQAFRVQPAPQAPRPQRARRARRPVDRTQRSTRRRWPAEPRRSDGAWARSPQGHRADLVVLDRQPPGSRCRRRAIAGSTLTSSWRARPSSIRCSSQASLW